jgi:hypothetical protein
MKKLIVLALALSLVSQVRAQNYSQLHDMLIKFYCYQRAVSPAVLQATVTREKPMPGMAGITSMGKSLMGDGTMLVIISNSECLWATRFTAF